MRKQGNIKLVTIEGRRNYFEPELNYHTKKFFIENVFHRDNYFTKFYRDT